MRMYFPSGMKNLRACIRCRIIMTKDQFLQLGCPTCREVLNMVDNEGRVVACTTTQFQGNFAVIRPGTFASRFNGLDRRRPGCYALAVQGTIPETMREDASESDADGGASKRRRTAASPVDDLFSEGESDAAIGVSTEPAKTPTPAATPQPEATTPAVKEVSQSESARPSAEESANQSEATAGSTGKASSSTLILEPEGDAEFRQAPS